MMLRRSYKKNIAEGKSILIFSFVFAAFMRTLYYSMSDLSSPINYGGYFWPQIAPLLNNHLVSFTVSNIFVLFIAFYAAYINNRFAFIRENTSLPFAFTILIFSCHPSFVLMTPGLIGLVVILYCIIVLFDLYNGEHKQLSATKIGFSLAFGSLFVSLLWLLIPLFWIGLATMRSFSFKAFLTSIFGFFILYFPLFSYYLFLGQLNDFYAPFISISNIAIEKMPFWSFQHTYWLVIGFITLLLLISIVDDYLNSFKDKIKIRAYFKLLSLLLLFSGVTFLLCSIVSEISLYFFLGVSPFVLSHYFALKHNNITVLLFYFSFSIYLIICTLPFI